jgi:hypothetical protein
MREIPLSACIALLAATLATTHLGCTPAAQTSPNDPSKTGELPESDPNAPSGGGGGGAAQGPFESSTGEGDGSGAMSTTPIATKTPCGGLSGSKCGDGATCIDDPSDACDPNNGGAGCTGICVSLSCGAGKSCPASYKCGDDGACHAVKLTTCGGLELKPCPGGTKCIDDATDGCDPKTGGVSCPGVCMPQ